MKKYLFAAVLLISLAFVSYKSKAPDGNNIAEVNKVSGLYVFTDCYPIQAYEVIGSVKASNLAMNGQYEAVRNRLIREVKKKFPLAEAVIVYPANGGTDKCEAITFKK